MIIVLLPGLDGTGKLFKPFIEVLPSALEVQTISYDPNREQSYDELTQYVIKNLPEEDFVLLAESFSDPIAYRVTLTKPKGLKSLILVATFLENPRPFFLKFVPNSRIPALLVRLFFLGFSAKVEIVDLFNPTSTPTP